MSSLPLGPSDSGASVPPQVYRAGWDAGVRRAGLTSNPHEHGTSWWRAWRDGYLDWLDERLKDIGHA